MDKLWAKDVKDGERVKSVFQVARKAIPTAKSGKTYLSVTFRDKTGELEGRAFENVEPLAGLFDEKDFVEVEGQVGSFQGKPQLRLETVAKLDPTGLEAAEFAWVPPPEVKKPEKPERPERTGGGEVEELLWKELQALTDAVVDPFVKTLIRAFLDDDDVAHRLRRAPAAKTVHHAYAGGLLEHTVSSLKLAHRLADHYPQVDRDLLVAGAFFHDLGKIRELTLDRNTEYTDEGRLIGHHVMTAQWIHDKARRNGIPRELETQIVHLVLAHHGKVEYGSPRPPATLEALLTHYIDEIDSRVNSWLNLMGKEGGSRRWTDAQNVYNQHIWRGTLPTIQGEKPAPAAEVMTPVIYVPRGGQPQGPRPDRKQKPKPPRPERRPEPKPEGAAAEAKAGEAREVARPPERAAEERPQGDRAHGERPAGGRPERGPRGPGGFGGPGGPGHRGPGGPGGPGDRKPRYMGPRLPGDKGPQARPAKALTHNPFAALAAKLEGGGAAEAHAAPAPEAAPEPAEASAAEAQAPAQSAPPAPSEPTQTPPGAPAEGAAAAPEGAPGPEGESR
jgi:3'-5' exoribonuclease